MKVPKIANAMGHIDNDLISDAAEYKPTKRRFSLCTKWSAVAACLVLVAVVMGIFPMFHQSNTSPFVLTAYAMETENEIVGNVMELGKSVPISTISTSTGKECFVFSCDKADYDSNTKVTILMKSNLFDNDTVPTDEYNNYDFSEFDELATDSTKHYFVGMLGETKYDEYSFPLYMGENQNGVSNQNYSIIIMKNENDYTALLIESSNTN